MAKASLLLLAASIFVIADGHISFRRVGSWTRRFKSKTSCRFYGLKPVLDEYGLVKSCVMDCGPNHEEDYSYIHGHHCKPLPHGCVSSECSRCVEGFYRLFDHGKMRCVEHCPEDYKEEFGVCVELPRGCRNSACTACRDGYFYAPYPLYYGNKCRRSCPVGYVKDRTSNRCEKRNLRQGCADIRCYRCKNGYYKHIDASFYNRCVRECPTGYGPINGHCRRIPVSCLNANCTKCSEGYFFYEKAVFFQRCSKRCPVGYFADSRLRTCVPCEDHNCVTCNEHPLQCEKCRRSYSLLLDNDGSGESCYLRCPEGYDRYYDYSKYMFICEPIMTEEPVASTGKPRTTPVLTTETEPIKTTVELIRTTEPLMTSEEPIRTTAPNTTPGERIKTKKPLTIEGEQIKTTERVTTQAPTVPLPEGCNDPFCLQCTAGYYTFVQPGYGSKCLKNCPSGYYAAPASCLACSESRCSKCSKSPFRCESCKTGFISFYKNSNETVQCLEKCPEGYIEVKTNGTVACEKQPVPECKIENCATCANHEFHGLHIGCLECQAGYLLKRNIFKDECVAICPDGFYAGLKPGTGISACLDCDVQFCQICIRRKKCSQCFPPFVMDLKKGGCTLCPVGTVYNRSTKSCKALPKEKGGTKKRVTIEDLLPAK